MGSTSLSVTGLASGVVLSEGAWADRPSAGGTSWCSRDPAPAVAPSEAISVE